uniref:Uncharacterized protein n=1 Tax=Strongyloides stercoralis TaxID=6248 RepID=A0AAF5DIT9_STRER
MNSTVIKSESDREQFKRDLVKQKIRENFCSIKETFKKYKCRDIEEVFKNRSERGENEMEEEEGFKEIKDSESLSEHLKNVLMPDFIEGIKNKYHLDDIIEIIEGVDVPKSTLPGQPETTKFGSILSKLKVSYN